MPWNTYTAQGQLKQLSVASPLAPMIPISDTVLGASQASITVNVPSTYQHLRVVVSGRSDAAAVNSRLNLQFNGDTGANYDYQRVYFQGVSTGPAEAYANTLGEVGVLPGNTATASSFSNNVIDILNYTSTTQTKMATALGQHKETQAAGGLWLWSASVWWRNTAAITSITFNTTAANFVAGTRITIYGFGVTTPNAIGVGAFTPPTYATTLPSSPADGQQAILVDSTTTPTYQWTFRYNNGSGNASKWECIGGAPLTLQIADPNTAINAQTQIAASGYYYPTSGVNSFVPPKTGQYAVTFNGHCDPNGAAAGYLSVGFCDTGGAMALGFVLTQAVTGQLGTAAATTGVSLTGGTTYRLGWNHGTPGTVKMRGGNMSIMPIRVS